MNLLTLTLEGVGGYEQPRTFKFKPGLNLIVGPNEAGKSSLKRAAEIALVGFRSAQDRHMDSDQSRIEAVFETQKGRVRILRAYGKRMNGQRITESLAGAGAEAANIGNGPAFEGMEPEVFASLFSIGLEELNALRAHDWETIESRLVGHFASTGMALPSEVMEQLAREMAAIYRENGRGNYEVKSLLTELKSLRERRLTAVGVLESEAGLETQIEALSAQIDQASEAAALWQSRTDCLQARPDLLALAREAAWYAQRLQDQDEAILPDREAFEVFENNRQRMEALVEPQNRAQKSSVRLFAAAIGALVILLGLSAGLSQGPLAFAGIALAGFLAWKAMKEKHLAQGLEHQRHQLEHEEAIFLQELPFQGPLAVEESLALLELREAAQRLNAKLGADPDYIRFTAWLPNRPLEDLQGLAMKARLELAALENQRLTLELKSRRQEITSELEDLEQEILRLERLLTERAAQWNRRLLESLIVEGADRAFKSQRRYDFLAAASLYLNKLTDGRYTAILAQADAPGRFVIEGPQGLKPVDSRLSRGTQEQVYLSLKLGLVDALDPEGQWPVFLDDVAVNFDRVRRTGFDALLKTVSQRRQVFYLTFREDLPPSLDGHVIRMTWGSADTFRGD